MKKKVLILIITGLSLLSLKAQIQITVNPEQEIQKISPYIYGMNNAIPDPPDTDSRWQKVRDSGVTMVRQSGGNNCTKYNWRKKLTGHPDWYQNVYRADWDAAAQRLQTQAPLIKGLWGLQLLGWAAKTGNYNFNDWGYNQSNWWEGVNYPLAGGGMISPFPAQTGVTPTVVNYGDPNLYLENWPADSTVMILPHWFDELKLNKEQFEYWCMDNEADIWNSTHRDVMGAGITAEEYIQKYVTVATKARTLFPEIKLVGPEITNEWQWYNWQNQGTIPDPENPGKKYCWSEYFIKRIAEEQQRTGIRLLDVMSFHSYLDGSRNGSINTYRVFYDTEYVYPGANGVKTVNGGWDASINKEYIFKRATDWLNKYMGPDHGVTLGITELGSLYGDDANVIAVSYASLLGTFAENNVEIFTMWDWYVGQWETVHLFTHYTGSTAVRSTSSDNLTVSAYSSINTAKDMLSIVLVNRDLNNSQSVKISPTNALFANGKVACHQLYDLPVKTETFASATQNALKHSEVDMANSSIEMNLPKLSVTVVQIPLSLSLGINQIGNKKFQLYPNPAKKEITLETSGFWDDKSMITINDTNGRMLKSLPLGNRSQTKFPIDISSFAKGIYLVTLQNDRIVYSEKLIIK